ncbi:MAG: tetratricopeptide repeat protein [Armatimonadetes bacterium]|nr:tetratricopeptide repeat protein [Armatimonadota bacterium]
MRKWEARMTRAAAVWEESPEEARRLLEEALQDAGRLGTAFARTRTLHLLGALETEQENYDKGARYFRSCISLIEEHLPADHEALLRALEGLAVCCDMLEADEESEKLHERIAQVRTRALPHISRLREAVLEACAPLEKKRVQVEPDFYCCSTCAVDALGTTFEEHPEIEGAVYWHAQDEDRMWESGLLCLRFVGNRCSDEEVANLLVSALERRGIRVDWDGDPRRVVEVRVEDQLPGF